MKLAKADAYNMLNFLSKWMEAPTSQLTEKESRMLLMVYFTLFSEPHASYSTDQILAAFGAHTDSYKYPLREGIYYSKQYNIDLFFITLNKSEKHYKTSTMYEDYAINEWLFHWQSQSRTTVESPTGRRYVNMRENGTKVILFVREEKKDEYSATEVYTCLGLADYVSHQGSSPISITYKLHEKMPMNVLRRSNLHVDIV